MPYAIIGIDRAYTVPSRYWISFTPEPDQLRKMSGNIFQKGRVDPYGSLITSPDDKIVGIWVFEPVQLQYAGRSTNAHGSDPVSQPGEQRPARNVMGKP